LHFSILSKFNLLFFSILFDTPPQKHLEQLLQKAFNQPISQLHIQEDTLEHRLLIGQSLPIQQLRITLKKIARSQAPVFITGESGTGKEVVANLVHRLSNRNEGPFIAINCGAIPTELMESELFGHRKGSFTGATQDKQVNRTGFVGDFFI